MTDEAAHGKSLTFKLDGMEGSPVRHLSFLCGKSTFLFKAVMFNHTPINFPLKYSSCAILGIVMNVGGFDFLCFEQSPEQSYQR